MANLRGATIKEFKETVEVMRSVYPFTDDNARIISTIDLPTNAHTHLELYTVDEKTGVKIIMQKDMADYNPCEDE